MNNTNTIKFIQLILVLVLTLMAGNILAAPIMVANPSVPVDGLSEGDIPKIFLGKTANWSDGSRVMLAMIKKSDVSSEFLKKRVRKSQKQFSTFWKKAVFSGTGEMPATFDNEAALVAFIAKTPGAIGYIDESTPHDGVKVIAFK